MTEAELAKLYARYGYVVFRRCLVYVGDPAAAQELVQEIFLRVVRGWDAFQGQSEPQRWFCRQVDELCLSRLRHQRRAGVVAAVSGDQVARVEQAVGNDDLASLMSMHQLVGQLDPEACRLAVLYFMDELSEEEVARELGMSRRSVEKRERELLQRTRSLLKLESPA